MTRLVNLGCKLNQYEGHCLVEHFEKLARLRPGAAPGLGPDGRDLVVVNTCVVTKEAERKSFKRIRQALSSPGRPFVIITGCLPQRPGVDLPKVDMVVSQRERETIVARTLPRPGHTRYFLKIQDGCDCCCSYCIVPRVRGPHRSVAEERVVAEVQWARDLGYPEVVLTGVNLGAYGLERGHSLIDLLRRLGAIAGVPRVRLSSLEPNYLSDELLELFSEINICPHLHLPVQSADRNVLHRMGRDYAAGAIARWIETAVRRYPAFAFGADLITGFPGEDEAAFSRTYEFIDRLPIAYLHVFPYSPRPGTEAARMPDDISPLVKQHRVQRLRALSRAKSYAFRRRFVGQRVMATAEKSRRGVCGLSDNYIRFDVNRLPATRLFEARLTEVTELSTRGEAL